MPFDMLRKSKSVGVEFRRQHVILTLLRSSLGKVRLAAYEVHPLAPDGQKEAADAQCVTHIRSFLSRHQAHRQKVFVSIPREKTLVRPIRLPAAVRENLRKVLEYETPKYTPFDREDVYFDYQVIREDKESLHLVTVFARKKDVDPYLSILDKAGIRPAAVQIPSGAAINLFLYHQGEKDKDVSVLIDLSEPFFEMNILKGKDWQESLHLPLPKENREDKFLETFHRWELNRESSRQPAFYMCGGDSEPGQPRALPEPFSPPPLERIGFPKGSPRPVNLYSSIGLPLEGLTRTQVSLNLLPPPMRQKVRQVGKPVFFALVFLALFLAAGWAFGLYQGYRNELDTLRAEVKKRKPEVEAIERIQKKRGERAREISEFAKITSGEVSKVAILQELARILPPTVWIWNLKCPGRELEISGFADSASELISLLDRSPFFEKVEFLAPVTKERERRGTEERERERFKIKMRLEGGST